MSDTTRPPARVPHADTDGTPNTPAVLLTAATGASPSYSAATAKSAATALVHLIMGQLSDDGPTVPPPPAEAPAPRRPAPPDAPYPALPALRLVGEVIRCTADAPTGPPGHALPRPTDPPSTAGDAWEDIPA